MSPTWRLALAMARGIDGLNRRVGRFMVWPILGAVLVSAGNAFSRKLFDLSSNALLELQWYLFGLAFLCAAGYVLQVDEHVRIDAVAQHVPARGRAVLDLVVFVVFVLPLCVLLGWLGLDLTIEAWRIGGVESNALGPYRERDRTDDDEAGEEVVAQACAQVPANVDAFFGEALQPGAQFRLALLARCLWTWCRDFR